MARSQLHEQAAQARAQWREISEERFERGRAFREPLIMRDRARDLDGKPERARYGRGPSFKRRRAMRAIEGGIDFDSGEHLRIAREKRLARRKAGLLLTRDAPTCGPEKDLGRHAPHFTRRKDCRRLLRRHHRRGLGACSPIAGGASDADRPVRRSAPDVREVGCEPSPLDRRSR